MQDCNKAHLDRKQTFFLSLIFVELIEYFINRIANSLEFVLPCNKSASCGCDTEKFSPICGSDGKNYFSACHAGCSDSTKDLNSTSRTYHDCACMDGKLNLKFID